MIESFKKLVNFGLKPITLYQNTKIPFHKAWNENWSKEKQLNILSKNEAVNLGILLGDIVDVEGDTKLANNIVLELIGNYQHPCYRSQKSIHHLFLNPDKDLRIFKFNDIEFRGHGHQSVVPPSIINNVTYEWIDCSFPVPEMPSKLLAFYEKNKKKKKDTLLKPGHMLIACYCCRNKFFIHKTRYQLELFAFREKKLPWHCRACRTININNRCREIKKILKHNHYNDWREFICEY